MLCDLIAPPCISEAQASAQSFSPEAAQKHSCKPLGDGCAEFLCNNLVERCFGDDTSHLFLHLTEGSNFQVLEDIASSLRRREGLGYDIVRSMTGSFGVTKPVDSALQNGGMDVLVDFASGMLNFLINNTLELDSNSGKRRTIDNVDVDVEFKVDVDTTRH